MRTGSIYKIIRNTWTGTYTVLRSGKPVMLTKEKTSAMKKFIETHTITIIHNKEVNI